MNNDLDSEVPEGAAVLPMIPAELGVHPLLLAVLHTVVFLDGSEADVVNSEAAGETLEYVATYLQRLSGNDLRRIQEDLECLVSFARQEGWAKEEVRFLREFLSSYGISAEE